MTLTESMLERRLTAGSVRASVSARVSEPFSTEAELVGELLRCVRRAGRRDWSLELELDAGVGLADVVLCKRNGKTTKALELLASITPRLAPLLDFGAAPPVASIEDLAAALAIPRASALRVAADLRRQGLIRPVRDGLTLASIKVPPFQAIIAVEAKLSSWQQALVQAYRNRQFSDESWVVLDHCYHRPALKNSEDFARTGVGLASISPGGLYIHVAARSEPPLSHTKRWHAQAALSRRAYARFIQSGLLQGL